MICFREDVVERCPAASGAGAGYELRMESLATLLRGTSYSDDARSMPKNWLGEGVRGASSLHGRDEGNFAEVPVLVVEYRRFVISGLAPGVRQAIRS